MPILEQSLHGSNLISFHPLQDNAWSRQQSFPLLSAIDRANPARPGFGQTRRAHLRTKGLTVQSTRMSTRRLPPESVPYFWAGKLIEAHWPMRSDTRSGLSLILFLARMVRFSQPLASSSKTLVWHHTTLVPGFIDDFTLRWLFKPINMEMSSIPAPFVLNALARPSFKL